MADANEMGGVSPADVLHIPKRRRLTHAWLDEPGQPRQLCLYYGVQEICFDEPELLPFGEALLKADRFRADETQGWSTGAPYAWEQVKELLDALVGEGILQRVPDAAESSAAAGKKRMMGGAAPVSSPRTWSAKDDQCRALMREHVGIEIDLGHLEIFQPVYRIASPTLDADGRQVGEGNANPSFLFLDLPTERRICDYPGSRFHDEKPMNVTALKLMMRHWDATLGLAAEMRHRFLPRLAPRCQIVDVGDLHAFAIATLSLPGYMMVRGRDPVANGELDAGVAVLFRLVDGVRMTTQAMLFSQDDAHGVDSAIDAESVVDYCERHTLFLGLTGVCAGPTNLIREFLRLFIDGASAPRAPIPSLDDRVGDTESAIDYAMAGLQTECLVQELVRRKADLARALGECGALPAIAKAFHGIPDEDAPRARASHAAIFARAGRLWTPGEPAYRGSLDAALATIVVAERRRALAEWLAATARVSRAACDAVAAIVDDFFALERRALTVLDANQRHVNNALGRTHPVPLSGDQLEGALRPDAVDFGARLASALGVTVDRSGETTVLRSPSQRDAMVLR